MWKCGEKVFVDRVFAALKMWKLCGNYVEIIFSDFFPP
jgi:hypothetical protein